MSEPVLGAVVLAAGKGTRMCSRRPKVLFGLLGEPMLWYVHRALDFVGRDMIFTVVGHEADKVRAACPGFKGVFVDQTEQLGTGHALKTAWPALRKAGVTECLVVNGDTPLVPEAALRTLVDHGRKSGADLAFCSVSLDDPGQFGRVVHDGDGQIKAIVEAKDFTESQHGPQTGEVNAGVYWLRLDSVEPLLDRLGDDNAGGEFYITDLIGLAVEAGLTVAAAKGGDRQLLGINSPVELAMAEEILRSAIVSYWLERGVMIHMPGLAMIGPRVRLSPGAELAGPCELYGDCTVGSEARLMSHVFILDSTIEDGAEVRQFCHLQGAFVGPDCQVGPYARLRPGAVLEAEARVGNFVEVKKSRLGRGVKASHLSYLGDADIGAGTNIGAGTITCNYDGVNKHKTTLGEGVFVGSNTALVAPVVVGDGALIGAGSVITKDVEPGNLAITRSKQKQFSRKRHDS